jgi:hypothetical protein
MEAVGAKSLMDMMVVAKDVMSMFGVLEGRTNCNTALAVHENGNIWEIMVA